MTDLTEPNENAIEDMIDRFETSSVLDTIADIAWNKASHVRETWQDHNLATLWETRARRIERAADTIRRTEV